ncbi:RICIN domain-containing protein [Streptomyces thermodiastaticus]
MIRFRLTRALVCTAAAAALAGALTGSASAADRTSQDLINKTDGSRLALLSDSTGEGTAAITLRDPAWRYRTEVWDEVNGRWENGRYTLTLRNSAATKCLQPATENPTRGTGIVVRTCNGSDLQRWVLRPEYTETSRWWVWQPKVNDRLAMTLKRYSDGSWDTLYLDTSYPSDDRLWHLADNDARW